jgi:hypothetical protein
MRANILVLMLLMAAGAAHAGEMYRWVDKDGKVYYTDQPPPPEVRNMERKRLGDQAGEGPIPYALQQAMKKFPVVLYTAEGCGDGCKGAVDYLNGRGIPYTQKDARQQANADALMALTGGKLEVPVATVGASVLRGYEKGAWKNMLDAAGYPSAPLTARPAPKQAPPAAETPASPPAAGQEPAQAAAPAQAAN